MACTAVKGSSQASGTGVAPRIIHRPLEPIMSIPLAITYHDLEPSNFTEHRIREHARELEVFGDQIIECHVTVGPTAASLVWAR
jgi:hypothetical protein